MYGKLLDRNRKRVEDRLVDMLKAQRHAVDRIVQRYRRLGAVLLDLDVGDDELRARMLSTVPEAQLHEDQSDLANWTRGDRRARFEQTAERHAGLSQFAAPFLSRMKFVDEQGGGTSPTLADSRWRARRPGPRARTAALVLAPRSPAVRRYPASTRAVRSPAGVGCPASFARKHAAATAIKALDEARPASCSSARSVSGGCEHRVARCTQTLDVSVSRSMLVPVPMTDAPVKLDQTSRKVEGSRGPPHVTV